MIPEHYKTVNLTTTAAKANLYSILFFLPFAVPFSLAYFMLWHDTLSVEYIKTTFKSSGWWFFICFFGGIIVHELIHGITWSLFAKQGFKSMKFGVLWKSLTPYCHCKEPLLARHYIIGGLMPAIILGILPLILSLFNGSLLLFVFGLFYTMAAGGDFLIAWMLRKQSANDLVQDHPSVIGCILYVPEKNSTLS